jgi:hypothetical protein
MNEDGKKLKEINIVMSIFKINNVNTLCLNIIHLYFVSIQDFLKF